jgi:hypothetical protein
MQKRFIREKNVIDVNKKSAGLLEKYYIRNGLIKKEAN